MTSEAGHLLSGNSPGTAGENSSLAPLAMTIRKGDAKRKRKHHRLSR
jgi:hypothetical protein